MPGRKMRATPKKFETMRPSRMAQRTYEICGRRRWCSVERTVKACSSSLPSRPIAKSSAMPGRNAGRLVGFRGTVASGDAAKLDGLSAAMGIGMVWVDIGRTRGDRWCGPGGRGPRTRALAGLERDLVNDAEANQCGEGETDSDGEQVHVDGQPVAGAGLRGAGCFGGCHKSPW